MPRVAGRRAVVRLVVLDARGRAVRRVRVRSGAPAADLLDALLRRALAERRAQRSIRVVDAPDGLDRVLHLCGLEAVLPVSR